MSKPVLAGGLTFKPIKFISCKGLKWVDDLPETQVKNGFQKTLREIGICVDEGDIHIRAPTLNLKRDFSFTLYPCQNNNGWASCINPAPLQPANIIMFAQLHQETIDVKDYANPRSITYRTLDEVYPETTLKQMSKHTFELIKLDTDEGNFLPKWKKEEIPILDKQMIKYITRNINL